MALRKVKSYENFGSYAALSSFPLSSIRQVSHKVVHGHIENMRAGVHDHVLPWEGDMDLAVYLQALADVGFDGGLALDLYKYDYEDVAPQCISYISKLLERVGAS